MTKYFEELTSCDGVAATNLFPDIRESRPYRQHGCVFYAECDNDVYHEAFGYHSEGEKKPMDKDSIFSIYSMSKLITTLVGLKCYELGLFQWNDNVDDFIPELSPQYLQVVTGIGTKEYLETVIDSESQIHEDPNPLGLPTSYYYIAGPCTKHIQMKHLFSQQSGFGGYWYGIPVILALLNHNTAHDAHMFAYPGGLEGLITANLYTKFFGSGWTQFWLQEHICTLFKPKDGIESHYFATNLESVRHLAHMGTLTEQPGEGQTNGHDFDILAAVLEVCWEKKYGSFKRFKDICSDLLFEPLGMHDSGHFVGSNDERHSELCKRLVPQHFKPLPGDAVTCVPVGDIFGHFHGQQTFDRGMAGMFSTVTDFAKVLRLLLNDGVHRETHTRMLRSSSISAILRYKYMPAKFNWFTYIDCVSRNGVWGMGGLRNFGNCGNHNKDNFSLQLNFQNINGEISDFQEDYYGW
eukprot:CAMPEP_0183810244 /NCGR_PEP_ID=MMETSP0803_2-20130417/46980_1 /TAXON_ID=195967 /ORGANISM="Crustomastix stigmata, Strain CCMP3273" /LENGTH=464 /DNA_ID=CAMNT_0026055057 /DNA_START=208 /DNA_END=1599 /DNA_ORIENTATION=+